MKQYRSSRATVFYFSQSRRARKREEEKEEEEEAREDKITTRRSSVAEIISRVTSSAQLVSNAGIEAGEMIIGIFVAHDS